MRPATRIALVAPLAAAGLFVAIPAAQSDAEYATPEACSAALAAGQITDYTERRECVISVASTFLAAESGELSGEQALLHDEVARYRLGDDPAHAPGGDDAVRAAWAAGGTTGAISKVQWTVDDDVAFAAYRTEAPTPHYNAMRITLRDGLVHEVLENPTSSASDKESTDTRTPFRDAVALAGPMHPPVDINDYDPDNAAWCSLVITEQGDEVFASPDDEKRCLIAIAKTYVDAEGNTTADSLTLFDPRFSKYSLGGPKNHHPGNGDTNRMDQTVLSPTIRLIDNQQWTADPTTDQVWIVYDGYLPVSTTEPGFYVAERFTIRDGLIWEIMISPVVVDVPNSLVPQAPAAGPAPEVRATVATGPQAATAGYATRTVVVRAGSGADFLNADNAGHDVVSEAKDANAQRLFRSAVVGTGKTTPIVGVEGLAPGTYTFFCSVHSTMRGSLVVQ